MNLTVRIHDKEYKEEVAQGITFSEEYNETLDSGTVRLTHVKGQIEKLRPYDDVYIYDSDYDFDENIANWRAGGEQKDTPFYRHLLVDQFSEDIINLSEGIFSYTIELFSETKGLETVQCPNISVTQPLYYQKKVDIYTNLVRFVKLYSPKYKAIDQDNPGHWKYLQKYTVSPDLEGIFSGFYPQDFTLSNPTLRDILSSLMVTKDMIPYVKDGIIYAKDITARTKSYSMQNEQAEGRINRISGQMSSADYCDGVRRQYSDALSSEGVCHFVEYLGFRNKDEALMTLANMQLETTHKIYKVNKFALCYYRDVATYDTQKQSICGDSALLCKQDMTPLVKVEQEWQVLSQDWRDLEKAPKTIEEFSKYKLSTVHYSIGGNIISGWGTYYQIYDETSKLPIGYDITKTYIENIVNVLDKENKLGNIISFDEYKKFYSSRHSEELAYIAPLGTPTAAIQNIFIDIEDGENPLKYKTVFFEIEYEGFYDGALIHSRDKGRDNFYQNDNVSASLTLLEKDGVNQKEKLNRFANKTYAIKGRLSDKNYNIDNLFELGGTCKIGEDDDVIIYRRQYSIYNNYIEVSYAGINDYVLRNFYTSVYAKYRVNQLMSYNESINRAENKKVILLLSKDKKYKNEDTFFSIIENTDEGKKNVELVEFFSAFVASNKNKNFKSAIISTGTNNTHDRGVKNEFCVDLMSFYSGNIMCFNIAMPDNASGGNFISSWASPYQLLYKKPSEQPDYFVGSEQQWYNIVDDTETGFAEYMSFGCVSTEEKLPLIIDVAVNDYVYRDALAVNRLAQLPKRTGYLNETETISMYTKNEQVYKDNKDRIDMTLQIEPISDCPNDIVIGPYLVKLSNLMIDDSIKKIDTSRQTERWDFRKEITRVDVAFFISGGDSYIWIATPEHDDIIDTYLSSANENERISFSAIIDLSDYAQSGASFHFDITQAYWHNIENGKNTERVFIGKGYYQRSTDSSITYITELHCPFKDYSAFADKDIPLSYKKGYIYSLINNQLLNDFDTFSVDGTIVTTLLEKAQSTTLDKNMFIEFSDEAINKNSAYQILSSQTSKTFSSVLPKDIFKVEGEGDDCKIKVDLAAVPTSTKSISYWYLDFDTTYSKNYSGGSEMYNSTFYRSMYHFVFGVNITEQDISRGYINIYITKTTNRDERVFDEMGRQVGVIHNYVNEQGELDSESIEFLYDELL